ncbi:MAG: SMP-30/gluconolactonase/LRE family protein [Chloroflexota bacterium]|nr:SMP-30/gluconolactonase/LRE family protein [Chloroflexota bacterium]
MRKLTFIVVLALFLLAQQPAVAAPVGQVQNFGPDLSTSCNLPEGIAADDRGRIYASSLNFGAATGPANICVLSLGGRIVDVISVSPATAGGVAKLLGMIFVPGEGLYVGDMGGGRVLRINVRTHAATTIATGFGAPNAFARDRAGNLWVSDSFPGTITRIAPNGATTVFGYPTQLAPLATENPPFGANGLAFDRDEHFLYVAMTARDQVFRIAYQGGSLGAISLFKQGTNGGALDGADGIAFDVKGNLYVCSNQSDEVAVLSPSGAVIAEYRGTGANAFNAPASLVFRGKQVYVTNLGLFHGGPQKLSTFKAPNRGAPLVPSARDGNNDGNDEDEQGDED